MKCIPLPCVLSLAIALVTPLGAQSLTTTFASNNGFAGNMFDITPAQDLVLTAMDINTTNAGTAVQVELWVAVGGSRGVEQNPSAWTSLGTFSAISAGQDVPTPVSLLGNGMVFRAGVTYGLFVDLLSYPSQYLRYTNGVAGGTVYSNPDLSLRTNVGNGSGGLGGFVFADRDWNGTLYYRIGGPSPRLSVAGFCPGLMIIQVDSASPHGLVALAIGLGGGSTTLGGSCAGLRLDLMNPTLAAIHRSDATGSSQFLFMAPAGACGRSVQAVDLQSCRASNVSSLP